jgi:hypothetical protein
MSKRFAPTPKTLEFSTALGNSSTVEQRTLTAFVSVRFQELSSRELVQDSIPNQAIAPILSKPKRSAEAIEAALPASEVEDP